MEGHCSTGQSPQRAVVPMEEKEDVKFVPKKIMTLKSSEILS